MFAEKLEQIFPLYRNRNVAIFYILSSVINAWFIAGIWIFIWSKFMTNQQIGISDAITFTIGFLLELPSGAIADKLGRKKAIVLGHILLVTGNLLCIFASSFYGFTLGFMVFIIGFTFQSGATEALVYDSIKTQNLEKYWPHIIARTSIIGRITLLISVAIGGFLYSTWFRLPYLVSTIYGIIGIIASLSLYEPKIKYVAQNFSPKIIYRQTIDGISVIKKPIVFPTALIALTVGGISYMFNWGLLKSLTSMRFGFTPETMPLLFSTASITTIIALLFLPKLVKIYSAEKSIILLGLLFSIIYACLFLDVSWIVGGLLIITLGVSANYIDQLFSIFINHHTTPEHRATTLSAVSMFTHAPYVFLALITGYLADKNLLPELNLIIGCISIIMVIYSISLYYNYTKTN